MPTWSKSKSNNHGNCEGVVIVVHLVHWMLPTQEIHSWSPTIGKKYLFVTHIAYKRGKGYKEILGGNGPP